MKLANLFQKYCCLNDGSQISAIFPSPKEVKAFNCTHNAPFGKPYVAGAENMIFSKNCFLSMDTVKTGLNNNSMIIGGPASGKTYGVVLPNLLQMYGSYVVIDPYGDLRDKTSDMFKANGYKVQALDFLYPGRSTKYNPFAYMTTVEDAMNFVRCVAENTEPHESIKNDEFVLKCEEVLLQTITLYIMHYLKKDGGNLSAFYRLLSPENTDTLTVITQLDNLFNEVRNHDADDICVKHYDAFRQLPPGKLERVFKSAANRLAPFATPAIEEMTSDDEMSLEELGDVPTITYIITGLGFDNHLSEILSSMLISQAYDALIKHLDDTPGKWHPLKYGVRFILDEAANIGVIPDFLMKTATSRKTGISFMFCIQDIRQLEGLYTSETADMLMSTCDTLVYLGGSLSASIDYIRDRLGSQTIYNRSQRTKKASAQREPENNTRELLTEDEIRKLDEKHCIVLMRDCQPFYDWKYPTKHHPNATNTDLAGKTDHLSFGNPENVILSKNCCFPTFETVEPVNKHVLVMGEYHCGKKDHVILPNLLQKNGSYVVTDPAGKLMAVTGRMFEQAGYKIRIFNLIDMVHSNRYNPFAYLRSEEDVRTLVLCLINNTDKEARKAIDPFWVKTETALFEAIIFYLLRYQKKDKQNFATVLKLLRAGTKDPTTALSSLDKLFNEVKAHNADDICVRKYDNFKITPEKAAQAILVSAMSRLMPFDTQELAHLTSEDEMHLSELGDEEMITYIVVPQDDNPYKFLVNMMYSQIFDALDCNVQSYGEEHLKYCVHLIMDEFTNCGVFPKLWTRLPKMNDQRIFCMFYIQSITALKSVYGKDWKHIADACDNQVYLGGASSAEYIHAKYSDGDCTYIDVRSGDVLDTPEEFLTPDELSTLEPDNCIVFVSDLVLRDLKYPTKDHLNARWLGDLDKGTGLYKFEV